MRPINKIIIHCSATPEGRHHTAADIRRWHLQQGYSDIGYHFVVLLDGTIEKGRDESIAGAHCIGQNSDSIGICYVGGCNKQMQPKDTRTPQQVTALRTLVAELKTKYPTITGVFGHCDFAAKPCPCFDVKTL